MSLVTTLMQPLWARYTSGNLDKNEVRPSHFGGWQLFQNQSTIENRLLSDETVEKAKRSMGNTVSVPVLNAENITIGNARSCTIAADDETSALVTLTWVTYSFGFTMTPARHFNNEIDYQNLFTKKLREYLIKFAKTLDSAAIAQLENDRNIYFPSAITNYYANSANALQIADDEKNDFFNQLSAIHEEMDFGGEMVNILQSTSMNPIVARLMNQGVSNDENDAFQFDFPYNFNHSNRVSNGAGIKGTVYSVPNGMIQTINRNTPDSMMGSRVGDHQVWGMANMPIVNLEMGTYYTASCADMSALDGGGSRMSHLSRSKVEGFAFDTDVCFITSYNSDKANTFSPILKSEIANPA